MTPHDTLRDRLLDAAGSSTPTVPGAAQVRRSAARHRAQRRVLAGSAVLVTVAAVAVAGGTLLGPRTASFGPATQPPVTTSTAAPTVEPTQSTTAEGDAEQDARDALQAVEAGAFVEGFRFADEEEWAQDVDFPAEVDTTQSVLDAHFCEAARADGLLATRQVLRPGPESSSRRQLALFPDASTAADAFDGLRSAMRPCHAPVTLEDAGTTWNRSVEGGQLQLGDESFWVASKDVVVSSETEGDVGTELFYSTASLFVLDDNVVVHIEDPAFSDEMRAAFVEQASAEWERLRPAYGGVLR